MRQQRHLPRIQSTLAVNHRSAARTAMPDLQLGIRVDAKRCERAKVNAGSISKSTPRANIVATNWLRPSCSASISTPARYYDVTG